MTCKYKEEGIYNVDETAMFLRALPRKSNVQQYPLNLAVPV